MEQKCNGSNNITLPNGTLQMSGQKSSNWKSQMQNPCCHELTAWPNAEPVGTGKSNLGSAPDQEIDGGLKSFACLTHRFDADHVSTELG